MEPLISVIIPVYNVEKYIDKCLNSVVNQTYRNLEIIVVDDGSPDRCPQICDEWAEKDNRIKVIHKQNCGLSSARNSGMNLLNGEYFTFVDSDDWIDLDCIMILYKHAIQYHSDVVGSGFYYEHLNRDTEILDSEFKIIKDGILNEFISDQIRPEVCSKLYQSSNFANYRFNENTKYAEDVEFNYLIFKQSQCYCSVGMPLYHYLQNSGNSSTTPVISDARAKSYRLFEHMVLDSKPDSQEYKSAICRFTSATFAILSRVLQDNGFAEKYYNEIVNALIKYKKDILLNENVSSRHKSMVRLISLNKHLFKLVVKIIR